ncbi:MAG: S-layer homology domain-containing protein [Candidatus Margulisiibacteriota bacterium]|nr:S-layer homology domain-containing protein [Candidatus Margulisiibacteriota bacterium]
MYRRSLALFILILFSAIAFGDLKIANDPATVGIGARALGMGGVMLNFSDISSLMGNPAALAEIDTSQYTMMAGRFINDVDYLSVGGIIPSPWGVVGVTYLNSQLTYTGPSVTTEVVDGIRILPSTTEVSTDTYRNSGIYLSFSKAAEELTDIDLLKKVSLGGTLKIFSQQIVAPGANGDASGYEIDLGMQYKVNSWMKYSLVGKNVLPAAMGGKLTWSTGREESYPYYIRTGIEMDFGQDIKIANVEANSLSVGMEYDYRPQGNAPNLLHYGLEWGIGDILDIRFGQDQGYIGQGGTSVFDVANNLTYGVGVTYKGWRFDYAFHEYYDDSENNTSYFSLTYGIPYAKKLKPSERIRFSPGDRSVVDKARVDLIGVIIDKNIKHVFIKDEYLDIVKGSAVGELELELGRNSFIVLGIDDKRREIFNQKLRILRLVGFKDVGEDYWAKDSIELLATLGLIKGYPGDLFKPGKGITRAEFATLLARIAGRDKYKPTEKLPFKDLPEKHWSYSSVAYAVDAGLMKGYPEGTFKPNKKISRAEGVVVIARFAGLDLNAEIYEIPFKDVPGRHWAIYGINAAKLAGLLRHLEDKFEPKKDLSRAETAGILSNVGFIKKRTRELLDFNKGYK